LLLPPPPLLLLLLLLEYSQFRFFKIRCNYHASLLSYTIGIHC
jgi:hypothetical protein